MIALIALALGLQSVIAPLISGPFSSHSVAGHLLTLLASVVAPHPSRGRPCAHDQISIASCAFMAGWPSLCSVDRVGGLYRLPALRSDGRYRQSIPPRRFIGNRREHLRCDMSLGGQIRPSIHICFKQSREISSLSVLSCGLRGSRLRSFLWAKVSLTKSSATVLSATLGIDDPA